MYPSQESVKAAYADLMHQFGNYPSAALIVAMIQQLTDRLDKIEANQPNRDNR